MPRKRSIILSYLQANFWLVAAALLLGCLINGLTLLIPLSIGRFYELTGNGHQARSALLGKLPFSLGGSLELFFLSFGALIALRYILQVLHRSAQGWIGEGLSAQLRESLFSAQLSFPESEYAKTGKGKYLLRFSGDLGSIRRLLNRGILDFAADLVLIAGLIFLLSHLLPLTLLTALLFFGFVCLILLAFTGTILRQSARIKNDRQASLLAYINRKLLAVSTIQVFNRQVPELSRMQKRSQRLRQAGIRFQVVKGIHDALAPAMVYGCLFLIMAGYAFPSGYINGGAVDADQGAAYLTAMLLVLFSGSVIRRTFKVAGVWKPGFYSLEKVRNIMDKADSFGQSNRVEATIMSGSDAQLVKVELPASAALVLEDVVTTNEHGMEITLPSLSTRAGRVCAVPVRPEQASAVLGLLSGNSKPSFGSATLGKVALKEVGAFALRRRVSFLSPQFPLVGETVLEAISYSRDKSARTAAEQMLLACQEDLPQEERLKIHDKLKDNGQYLSETQRFRLQAARILLTGKRLLVLDLPIDQIDLSALELFKGLLRNYLVVHKASAIVLERSVQSRWVEVRDSAS